MVDKATNIANSVTDKIDQIFLPRQWLDSKTWQAHYYIIQSVYCWDC